MGNLSEKIHLALVLDDGFTTQQLGGGDADDLPELGVGAGAHEPDSSDRRPPAPPPARRRRRAHGRRGGEPAAAAGFAPAFRRDQRGGREACDVLLARIA